MQHEHNEAILMLRNNDNRLRTCANEKSSLEEQNRGLLEYIKILERENCALELKNNQLKSNLAKQNATMADLPDEKQPYSSTSIRSDWLGVVERPEVSEPPAFEITTREKKGECRATHEWWPDRLSETMLNYVL